MSAWLLAACEPTGVETTSVSSTPVEATTTIEAATTIEPATTSSSIVDIDNAETVSAVPIDLPDEILAASEGLILGVGEDFTFPDGAKGLRDIVVRVENGVATALRGRWCGSFFGPAPLDDMMDGAVVASDGGGTIRCTPGEEFHPVDRAGPPLDSAIVDDRAVVALPWFTDIATGVDLLDLITSERANLYTADRGGEFALAASRSDRGEWIITLAEAEAESPRVRYVFVDDTGDEIVSPANPQPTLPGVDTGLRSAAFSPEGDRLAIVAERRDGSTDVIIWDLTRGIEVRLLEAIEDTTGERVRSISLGADRLVANIESRAEETHPAGFVVVDIASDERTEISGIHDPLEFRNASLIER